MLCGNVFIVNSKMNYFFYKKKQDPQSGLFLTCYKLFLFLTEREGIYFNNIIHCEGFLWLCLQRNVSLLFRFLVY